MTGAIFTVYWYQGRPTVEVAPIGSVTFDPIAALGMLEVVRERLFCSIKEQGEAEHKQVKGEIGYAR
jgi:hypothetical protein